MNSRKLTAYILYALGEIALVVIGILIAVQIDNWNENRKLKQLESKILAEISNDLEQNIESLENDLFLNQAIITDIQTLTSKLKGEISDDSLSFLFGHMLFNTTITLNHSGYDNLKNLGFHIIRNDSVRKSISTFFELDYEFIKQYELKDQEMTQKYFTPRYLEYFESMTKTKNSFPNKTKNSYPRVKLEPGDLPTLRKNAEFLKLLSFLNLTKKEIIYNLKLTINKMSILKRKVDNYLINLS